MIKSMTAFARQEGKIEDVVLIWEIRSVNHRHLDIVMRLPDALNAYENGLKETIKKQLGRGRVELKLIVQHPENHKGQELHINESMVKSLLNACSELKKITHKSANLSAMEILQWPGVLEEPQKSSKKYAEAVEKLLEKTLHELIKMREREGARLLKMIVSRCAKIDEIVKQIQARRVDVLQALREKVQSKLAELEMSADQINNNRLEQELVYQAQRLDVDEELDRLSAHTAEIISMLKRDEPIGRRLDFLMQELNREANTLASKANDAETTNSAVDLKVLIEQMREQCLNIE